MPRACPGSPGMPAGGQPPRPAGRRRRPGGRSATARRGPRSPPGPGRREDGTPPAPGAAGGTPARPWGKLPAGPALDAAIRTAQDLARAYPQLRSLAPAGPGGLPAGETAIRQIAAYLLARPGDLAGAAALARDAAARAGPARGGLPGGAPRRKEPGEPGDGDQDAAGPSRQRPRLGTPEPPAPGPQAPPPAEPEVPGPGPAAPPAPAPAQEPVTWHGLTLYPADGRLVLPRHHQGPGGSPGRRPDGPDPRRRQAAHRPGDRRNHRAARDEHIQGREVT